MSDETKTPNEPEPAIVIAMFRSADTLYLEDLMKVECEDPDCKGNHELTSGCCGQTAFRVRFDRPSGSVIARCASCGKDVARFAIADLPGPISDEPPPDLMENCPRCGKPITECKCVWTEF